MTITGATESTTTLDGATYVSGTPVSVEDTYALYVIASDAAGNVTTVSLTFTIDSRAPVVTITGVADGLSSRFALTPTISVSGARESTITLNGTVWTPVELAAEGVYDLVVVAVSPAGVKAIHSVTFTIDTTPPVVTVTGVIPDHLYNTPVTPAVTFTGASESTITLDGAVWTPAKVTAEGTHTIIAAASDLAGNTTTKSVTFAVDTTPPVVTVTGVILGHIYNTSVTPTVTIAGATESTITLDGAVWTPAKVTTEGTHTIIATASDLAGNTTTKSVTFAIDTTPPAGSFAFFGGSSLTSVTVARVLSNVVDAAGMRIGVDGAWGEWGPYAENTQTALPSVDATYAIHIEYRDAASNVLSLAHDIRLDRQGPAITGLKSTSHPDSAVPKWGPVTVTWDTGVDVAGVAGYSAIIDTDSAGDAPMTRELIATSKTFPTPPSAGKWYVHVRAVDGLGNWGPTTTITFLSLADTTSPTMGVSGIPTRPVNTAVTFSVTATDTASGVALILYRRDGGAETTFTSAVTVSTEGTHTLSYRAIDRAGNATAEKTVQFIIDKTLPVIGAVTFERDTEWVKALWACSPDVSGVVGYSVVVTRSGEPTWSSLATQVAAETTFAPTGGGWYVHVRALDAAGNWSGVASAPYERASVRLSRPAVVRRAYRTDRAAYQVSGSIVASAPAGYGSPVLPTGTVEIVVERLVAGQWVRVPALSRTTMLTATSPTSASYRVNLALSNRGSAGAQVWRVRTWFRGNRDCSPGMSLPSASMRVR